MASERDIHLKSFAAHDLSTTMLGVFERGCARRTDEPGSQSCWSSTPEQQRLGTTFEVLGASCGASTASREGAGEVVQESIEEPGPGWSMLKRA